MRSIHGRGIARYLSVILGGCLSREPEGTTGGSGHKYCLESGEWAV